MYNEIWLLFGQLSFLTNNWQTVCFFCQAIYKSPATVREHANVLKCECPWRTCEGQAEILLSSNTFSSSNNVELFQNCFGSLWTCLLGYICWGLRRWSGQFRICRQGLGMAPNTKLYKHVQAMPDVFGDPSVSWNVLPRPHKTESRAGSYQSRRCRRARCVLNPVGLIYFCEGSSNLFSQTPSTAHEPRVNQKGNLCNTQGKSRNYCWQNVFRIDIK